jgi:hypothetical protein
MVMVPPAFSHHGAGQERPQLGRSALTGRLAVGADHEALEVVVGMVLGLVFAEERGEPLVELDQLLGRGAHVVRRHGGVLPTRGESGVELASPSRSWLQATRMRVESKKYLLL